MRDGITAHIEGQIQHYFFFDSRQVVGAADDFLLLFPERPQYDITCCDIEGKSQSNMSMLETIVGITICAPEVLGAHPYGHLEFDAFGNDLSFNRIRFMNAYAALDWQDSMHIIVGQAMHPMRLEHANCFPRVMSRNHGAPIAVTTVFQPQLRITKKWGRATLLGALLTELPDVEDVSDGPMGFSSEYSRNGIVPTLHLQWYTKYDSFCGGAGLNYNRIAPRLVSNTDYKVDEYLNSICVTGFIKFKMDPLTIRANAIFAENGTPTTLLGGYAVSCVSPVTDERSYTNIRAVSGWVDIAMQTKIEPGIFVGVAKNIGASKNIIQSIKTMNNFSEKTVYGIAPMANIVIRAAPRIYWHISSLSLGAEFEYTRAWYGNLNSKGKPSPSKPTGNIRIQLGTVYYF